MSQHQEKEIWVDIKGYEGYYQLSSQNKVRSLDRYVNNAKGGQSLKKGKMLRLKKRSGYWMISLSKEGEIKMFIMHRLLAQHFIENSNNKPCVNHINGIKLDNSLSNLEWVTYTENLVHAFDNGLNKPLKGEAHPHTFLTKEQVIDMRNLYDSRGMRICDIARKYGMGHKSVDNIVKRKNWAHV